MKRILRAFVYVVFIFITLDVYALPPGSGVLYYVHNDPLGTPQAMTDESGNVVWTAETDPFGGAKVNEDPDGDGKNIELNVRFPGQYYDKETGLHYNYFRYYDPKSGRYLTSDPIGLQAGLNTYAYVEGNPLKLVDPFGLESRLCLRGLGEKPSGSSPPVINHTYGCVGSSSNGWVCGSSTASSGSALDNTWPFGPGSEGEATTDETDYFDEQSCYKVLDDDDCVEQCIVAKWRQPRPWYQVGPGGTDCQEYTYDVLISCEQSCRKQK